MSQVCPGFASDTTGNPETAPEDRSSTPLSIYQPRLVNPYTTDAPYEHFHRANLRIRNVFGSIIPYMPKYPKAIGPYSVYRFAGDLVFLAGQIGINPDTGELEEGIEAQTLRVIKNIANVLAEIGLGLDDVIKTTVFLKDIADYPKVNEIYGRFFHEPYPARSAVAVADLPRGALVEIEVIALRGRVEDEVKEGLELFKRGEYYESHEYWEKAFRKVRGEKRTFLSGLVNVDAALIKYSEGNLKGAVINFTKAKDKVSAMFPDHRLVEEIGKVIVDLESGREPDFAPLKGAVEEIVEEFLNAVE